MVKHHIKKKTKKREGSYINFNLSFLLNNITYRLQNEDSQLLWANNTISGTDQSNECNDGLITNNNGYHPSLNDNQLIPSLQEHHHLINCMDNNNSQQLASQYTCTCHTIPCECHVTPGSHDLTTPTTQQPLLTCRQEAMYNNDITVEELAGYFDELLHLPKPMSVMAELMYT